MKMEQLMWTRCGYHWCGKIVVSYVFCVKQVCTYFFLLLGHTAKVFRVKWCPLREGILVSGSDDKLVLFVFSVYILTHLHKNNLSCIIVFWYNIVFVYLLLASKNRFTFRNNSCHVLATLNNFHNHSPPIYSIRAVMLVWRLGGKIIRTVLCCIVYNSYARWNAHMWTVFKFACCSGLDIIVVCLFILAFLCFLCYLILFYSYVACFCYVGFSYFITKSRDWLERTSLKWLILCRVGGKTLTQTINQAQWMISALWTTLSTYTQHFNVIAQINRVSSLSFERFGADFLQAWCFFLILNS